MNTKSISFVSASSQYLNQADNALFKPASNFTVQAWVKTSTKSTFIAQSYNSPDGVNDYGWQLFIQASTGYVQFRIFTGPTTPVSCVGTTDVTDNTWRLVTGVYDTANSLMRVYVNGSQENTTAASASVGYDTTNYPTIGARRLEFSSIVDSYFNGNIDDVRLYGDVRTPSEILSDYNSPSEANPSLDADLDGYWTFNNTLTDLTSNNLDWTGVNSPTFSTDVAPVDVVKTTTFLL